MRPSKKVKIPLTLIVEVVNMDENDNESFTDDVAMIAADMLVTVVGIAPGHTERPVVHVDGFGKCKVTFNLSDIELAGDPTVLP